MLPVMAAAVHNLYTSSSAKVTQMSTPLERFPCCWALRPLLGGAVNGSDSFKRSLQAKTMAATSKNAITIDNNVVVDPQLNVWLFQLKSWDSRRLSFSSTNFQVFHQLCLNRQHFEFRGLTEVMKDIFNFFSLAPPLEHTKLTPNHLPLPAPNTENAGVADEDIGGAACIAIMDGASSTTKGVTGGDGVAGSAGDAGTVGGEESDAVAEIAIQDTV